MPSVCVFIHSALLNRLLTSSIADPSIFLFFNILITCDRAHVLVTPIPPLPPPPPPLHLNPTCNKSALPPSQLNISPRHSLLLSNAMMFFPSPTLKAMLQWASASAQNLLLTM